MKEKVVFTDARAILSVAVAGCALVALPVAWAQDQPTATLATAEAALEVAPRERIWDGTVEAINQATVSAQTSGRVTEILYDVDDFVAAGAVIMRLTDTEQRAGLRRAQAGLAEAESRFNEAEQELTRVSEMYQNQTVPRARYDQAVANHDAAEARLAAARSGVATAQEQLSYTEVRAPYAGIVSARRVEVGELVTPGQALMSGLSLASLRVNVDVPQSMMEPIRTLGKAYVYVGDQRIAGESLTFSPFADPQANTFRVRVNLEQTAETLYPGMFVKVGFVVGESERLLVPVGAVVRRSELTAVYVVAGGMVWLRQVRLGREYGEKVEILAGLSPGEQVALDPVAAGIFLKEHPGPR